MSNSSGGADRTTGAGTGFNTNVGTAQPGSPADEMGATVLPPSGGVGDADPGAGEDLTGDEQGIDRGIVDETSAAPGEQLRRRLSGDVDPRHSNVSGPTPLEEGRDQ